MNDQHSGILTETDASATMVARAVALLTIAIGIVMAVGR